MSAVATEPAINGWRTTPLKAEVTLKNGKAYNAKDWKKDGYPIIRIQNLKNPQAEFNYFQGDPETEVPIRSGDLVFSWSGSKGTSFGPHIWRGELGVLNQHIFKVVMNSDSQLGQDFLYYALRFLTAAIEDKAYGLAALVHVRKGDLEATPIPLPPLPEQKKIAHILSTVQRSIEAQERIIQTTTELKKALMHKLFTEGLRNEPQKQTEIGPIPESWEVVPLGDLLSIAQYGMSVKGNPEGNYPILRMTNQVNGRIVPNKLQFVEINSSDFQKFRLDRGDILFNRTNSLELVGRTAIHDIDGDYVFASYLIRLRTDEDRLTAFFLNLDFNRDETQVRLKSIATRAVSQSNISATRLKGFPFPLPSLADQGDIVKRAAAFDAKIELHRTKLIALQDLFRTLLHELMTAKTRVHSVDLQIQDA